MTRLALTLMTGLGFAVISTASMAQTAAPKAQSGKSWGKPDIDSMCDRPTDTPRPKPGYQYDGDKASEAVMTIAPGMYSYPLGGAMLVWSDNRYLIKLPSSRKGIFGTDGDDLLAKGGLVGGCSLEQLSEAISRNDLTFGDFKMVKRYTK